MATKLKIKRFIQSEIFVRVYVFASLLFVTWSAISAVFVFTRDDMMEPLETLAKNTAWLADEWLTGNAETIKTLATDPRATTAVRSLHDWTQTKADIRKALYEFSYLNAIRDVYIVKRGASPEVLSTMGAHPAMAEELMSIVNSTPKTATNGNINIGFFQPEWSEKTFIVSHSIVKPELGKQFGNVISFLPLSQAVLQWDAPKSSVINKPVIKLYQKTIDGNLLSLDVSDKKAPHLISELITDSPIQAPTQKIGDNNVIIKKGSSYTILHKLPNSGDWFVSASLSHNELMQAVAPKRNIILLIAIALSMAIFLTPLRGSYSDKLRHTYKSIPKAMRPAPKLPVDEVKFPKEVTTGANVNMHLEHKELLKFDSDEEATIFKKRMKYDAKGKKRDVSEYSDDVVGLIVDECIRQHRIELLYQPIIDANNGKVAMFEVFLRLKDDDGDLLPPGIFIPTAERFGLMDQLDKAVVEKVVQEHFSDESTKPLDAPLCINLSGGTFESISFLESIMASMNTDRLTKTPIIFELKSQTIGKDNQALSFIKEVKEMGAKFSIDYFGGGTQMLQLAKTLNFDYAKVDAFRFQEDLKENKDKQRELLALANTAKELDLPLVIERVETPLMEKFAKKVGFSFLQGYYFSQPRDEPHMELS